MKKQSILFLVCWSMLLYNAQEKNSQNHATIKVHKTGISGLTFLDDKTIATSCLDGTSKLVHLDEKKLEPILSLGEPLFSLSHGSKTLAYKTAKHIITSNVTTNQGNVIRDITTGKIAVNPEGTKILSPSLGGILRIWDVQSTKELLTLTKTKHPITTFTSVDWHSDNTTAATACEDGIVQLWNINDPHYNMVDHWQAHKKPVSRVHFSQENDNPYLLATTAGPIVSLWDMRNLTQPYKVEHNHKHSVSDVGFLTSAFLVSTNLNHSLHFWGIDEDSNQQILVRTTFLSHVPLSITTNIKMIAAGLANGEIELIKKENAEEKENI